MTTTIWHRSSDRQLKKVKFEPAVGAKIQFYRGGTTTPLTTYRDADASTPHNTGSLLTDGNGLWPVIFVPYGAYNYRILDSDDTIIATATNVPNPAPVDPTATDPNALMQTGDMIFSPAAVIRAGFVRSNGNTIGSGASSATERANNDAEALFTWIWNNLADAQATVSGGRGSTAAADWSANKVIATPDLRGSCSLGLDDMGAGIASRLGSAPFTHGNATTSGSAVGANTVTLLEANLPAHAHGTGTLFTASDGDHTHGLGTYATASDGAHVHGVTDPTHAHTVNQYRTNALDNIAASGAGQFSHLNPSAGETGVGSIAAATGISIVSGGAHTHTMTGSSETVGAHTHTISGATASTGSDTPTNIVNRSILGTWLLKL